MNVQLCGLFELFNNGVDCQLASQFATDTPPNAIGDDRHLHKLIWSIINSLHAPKDSMIIFVVLA
jgi:hypothetical protein